MVCLGMVTQTCKWASWLVADETSAAMAVFFVLSAEQTTMHAMHARSRWGQKGYCVASWRVEKDVGPCRRENGAELRTRRLVGSACRQETWSTDEVSKGEGHARGCAGRLRGLLGVALLGRATCWAAWQCWSGAVGLLVLLGQAVV